MTEKKLKVLWITNGMLSIFNNIAGHLGKKVDLYLGVGNKPHLWNGLHTPFTPAIAIKEFDKLCETDEGRKLIHETCSKCKSYKTCYTKTTTTPKCLC